MKIGKPISFIALKILVAGLLIFVLCACGKVSKKKREAANEENALSLVLEDTLISGLSVPIHEKWINPDSMAQPKVLPIGRPKEFPIYTHIHPAGKPKEAPVPKELPIITPGKNGIPLPKITLAKGRVVPAIQPPPTPALATEIKNNAIANFQHLNVPQGMSSSSVGALVEDHLGNIWFGTIAGGLSRFDGQRFVHYSQAEGLPHNSIYSMMEDSQGNIWFGTDFGNGVTKYDGHYFTHFAEKEGFTTFTVRDMMEDSKGNLWFGTVGGGVIKYDGTHFTHFTKREGLSGNVVLAILEDSQGKFWFGTRDGGVIQYDGHGFLNFTTTEGLSGNTVTYILEDHKGKLWFGLDGGGISCLDGHRFFSYTTEEGLSNNKVEAIMEDRAGNLWIGTNGGGASKFDGQNFTHFTQKEGLTNAKITEIILDHQGNLWFATTNGAIIYNDLSFGYYDGIETPRLEDKRGNLINHYNGGLNIYNYDSNSYTQYPLEEVPAYANHGKIIEGRRGDILICMHGFGLYQYDGQKFTRYSKEQGLLNNDIRTVAEDKQGNLWLGSSYQGVYRYDGTSFTNFICENWIRSNEVLHSIYTILGDSRGQVWIGSNGGGMSKFDGQHFTSFTTKEGLTSDQIYSIAEDSKGNIWIGTWNGGLNIYDGESFIYIDKNDGLSNNMIQSVVEDKLGRYWVGTRQGLDLLVPKHNNATSRSKLSPDDFYIVNFKKEDGLKSLGVGPGFLDSKNRIWWENMMLDLNRYDLSTEKPRIQLDYLELEQTFIDYLQLEDSSYLDNLAFRRHLNQAFDSIAPFYNYPLNLKLPYQVNHLTFHFSAIYWVVPHKINYQFMLQGLDKDWSPVTQENKADYRSLPHGTYTFKVRAAGQTMIWSEPFSYTFTIRAPWWLTWWAYCLYCLLILALFMMARQYEFRRYFAQAEARRLKELDSVKTRLYTNITHEFRTPLTVIAGMADQINTLPEIQDIIKRNSQRLLNLVNQMLNLSKLESGNLPLNMIQDDIITFLEYLLEAFQSYAESKQILLFFHEESTERIMDFDEEKLQSIISNLLSNAIKFSPPNSTTTMHVREKMVGQEKRLTIKVKDNGHGISPEDLPSIFDRFYQADPDSYRGSTSQGEGTGIGLSLTRELVHQMGGEITVESELGFGSEFVVSLPISHDAPLKEVELARNVDAAIPLEIRGQLSADHMVNINKNRAILLLIEDNRDIVAYIRTCLQTYYHIEVAEDGEIGVQKALELVPDIIISDVMMPKKDGFQVCTQLKTDERTSHIPIILLTAKVDMASRLAGLARGADAYLTKPFEKKELLIRLQQLLQLRLRLRERYAFGVPNKLSTESELKMEDAFLQKIRSLIEANLEDSGFGILQLCQALHLSRMQVHRKIKALTDQTTSQIIRTIRLQHAKKILQTSDLTISEIAYDTGFTDPNHFSRVFKEEFGVPPSELRK